MPTSRPSVNGPTPRAESSWQFGPVSGPLCASLAAVTAAVAEPVAHYPHWVPATVSGVGAAAISAISALRGRPLGLIAYRATAWVGAGAWTTWVISEGWSWAAAVAIGGGALVTGLAGELVREVDVRAEIRRGLLPDDGRRTSRPLTSRELAVKNAIDGLLTLPAPGVEITALVDWPTGSGYNVFLEFPAETGYGDDELRGIVIRLARRLRLPIGCVPDVQEGDVQGEVILRIPTLDDLSEPTEYPADYSPLSLYDMHPLGVFGDQEVSEDEMRESSKLIGGRKGGGKTNIEDVYGANLCRTTDALIWDIDLNGGGMSAFFMLPYALGLVEAPPIDWVAADADEALIMSEVLVAIAKARKAQYASLRAQANSRLLPLSAELPGITVRIDEGAEVFGDRAPYARLRENLKEAHRIGRESGINFIVSTLRPTGEMIPIEIRKNSSTRIGTRVEEDTELHYLFPNAGVKLRSRMLRTPGEAFISRGDPDAANDPVRRMKWFHLLPDRIREVVLATWHLRPHLDPFSTMVADAPFELAGIAVERAYWLRWERLGSWIGQLAETPAEGLIGPPGTVKWTGTWDAPTELPRRTPPPATTADALAIYAEKKRAAELARDRAARAEQEAHVRKVLTASDEEIAARLAAFDQEPTQPVGRRFEPPAPPTLDDRARLVANIVRDAGVSGIRRADLIERIQDLGIEVTDQTVSEWLRRARELGLIEPAGKKGWWRSTEEGSS